MKKSLSLLAAVALTASCAFAQGRGALRINEVMVENTNSLVDEYGTHTSWIELFNTNFAPLEISSVFLTTDPANPRMYPVPLGDSRTKIGKRQTVVFFADGDATRGTFHTGFVLEPGRDNWIGIYDANGKTLIDSVTVPATLGANQSYARDIDGKPGWVVRVNTPGVQAESVTPNSHNAPRITNDKIRTFSEQDENGFAMTLMAMAIVFIALLVLCLAFYAIGEIGKYIGRVNKSRATGVDVHTLTRDDHDSGEEIAAVVMALHEHLNMHDDESNMLTIKKMKRAYSPWSSKIYSLRQLPHR